MLGLIISINSFVVGASWVCALEDPKTVDGYILSAVYMRKDSTSEIIQADAYVYPVIEVGDDGELIRAYYRRKVGPIFAEKDCQVLALGETWGAVGAGSYWDNGDGTTSVESVPGNIPRNVRNRMIRAFICRNRWTNNPILPKFLSALRNNTVYYEDNYCKAWQKSSWDLRPNEYWGGIDWIDENTCCDGQAVVICELEGEGEGEGDNSTKIASADDIYRKIGWPKKYFRESQALPPSVIMNPGQYNRHETLSEPPEEDRPVMVDMSVYRAGPNLEKHFVVSKPIYKRKVLEIIPDDPDEEKTVVAPHLSCEDPVNAPEYTMKVSEPLYWRVVKPIAGYAATSSGLSYYGFVGDWQWYNKLDQKWYGIHDIEHIDPQMTQTDHTMSNQQAEASYGESWKWRNLMTPNKCEWSSPVGDGLIQENPVDGGIIQSTQETLLPWYDEDGNPFGWRGESYQPGGENEGGESASGAGTSQIVAAIQNASREEIRQNYEATYAGTRGALEDVGLTKDGVEDAVKDGVQAAVQNAGLLTNANYGATLNAALSSAGLSDTKIGIAVEDAIENSAQVIENAVGAGIGDGLANVEETVGSIKTAVQEMNMYGGQRILNNVGYALDDAGVGNIPGLLEDIRDILGNEGEAEGQGGGEGLSKEDIKEAIEEAFGQNIGEGENVEQVAQGFRDQLETAIYTNGAWPDFYYEGGLSEIENAAAYGTGNDCVVVIPVPWLFGETREYVISMSPPVDSYLYDIRRMVRAVFLFVIWWKLIMFFQKEIAGIF